MVRFRYIAVLVLCALCFAPSRAEKWSSYFAYNNVTQIAMTADRVYAMSDGSLYSVDKQTEKLTVYNRQSGLHGTNITCISYDEVSKTLIIAYEAGRMDLMNANGVQYISDLYNKDMTQEKTIYNISIYGRIAYLSTHYGVQLFDLRDHRFTDSYWLRPNGEVTPIKDVLLTADSIYAFADDSLYCARLKDNIVDYHFWKREKRSSRISPDPNKGVYYHDELSDWYAGHAEGIVRQTATERMSYKPEGPLSNIPYYAHFDQGRLFVLQGGRWDSHFNRLGIVMSYDGEHWTNIPNEAIVSTPGEKVLDFVNVAVDPRDQNHYFVTSYGTGLYEFQDNRLVKRYLPADDNTLGSTVPDYPTRYTRLDNATFDAQGNLWLLDAGEVEYQLVCYDAEGQWHGLPLIVNNEHISLHTPGGLVLDRQNANYKWLAAARYNTGLFLLDDGGTPFNASDDKAIGRNEWVTEDGHAVTATSIHALMQSSDGRIWVGTNAGIVIIDNNTDYFTSDLCTRPDLTDHNGENPMTELKITALCEGAEGQIWVGTASLGVYVLNSTATEILAHYTTDNSSMPSNGILSLAYDDKGKMYIGTGNGLAAFDSAAIPEHNFSTTDEDGRELGSIEQWRLHLSYTDPTRITATPSRIYALADGSLYYFDRASGQIEYMSKATGLNGSSITKIAYDASSEQLIVAYEDGRLDLIDEEGDVRQMPDLHLKANSISVSINSISCGKKHTYLAMSFGIIAINPKKAEVAETYYIGDNADAINVDYVVEVNDSLYAFTDGYMYSASLHDNIADYSFWKKQEIEGTVMDAFIFKDSLHILLDKKLYRWTNSEWEQMATRTLQWTHCEGGQIMTYLLDQGVYYINDKYWVLGLTNNYSANDALYSNGEYWIAEENYGLVRLNKSGDVPYHTTGPNSNIGYFLHHANGRVYNAIGGRWASQFMRYARVNIFDGTDWKRIAPWELHAPDGYAAIDPVSIAVDPNNADHLFIATYTAGVFEYNKGTVTRHGTGNSTLEVAEAGADPRYYTRTDGATMDEKGNLWVLNATEVGYPVHVMTPDHRWYALDEQNDGKHVVLTTPAGIWTDRRSTQRKWFFDQRVNTGVYLLDDGGTPTDDSDDRCIKRSTFVDQNNNSLTPSNFFCFAQDHEDRIWLGTESGIILIPAKTDFFTSNSCRRIIIPRNDGTGLGDYLLGDEQINCMAVDGGNRMWIGTANSGLYLIEDDTITVAHFTEDNSLLPSNGIQSITIVPTTGEVFVGTDKGIASYLSDASEAQKDMSHAYAYPNPVRPNYGGNIAITGLMENTVVNIVDASGNLVCKTKSHGGTAIWDGKLWDGRRATPGVYTALCNADGGHTVVKILVVR